MSFYCCQTSVPAGRNFIHSSQGVELSSTRKPLQSVFNSEYPKMPSLNHSIKDDSYEGETVQDCDDIDEQVVWQNDRRTQDATSTLKSVPQSPPTTQNINKGTPPRKKQSSKKQQHIISKSIVQDQEIMNKPQETKKLQVSVQYRSNRFSIGSNDQESIELASKTIGAYEIPDEKKYFTYTTKKRGTSANFSKRNGMNMYRTHKNLYKKMTQEECDRLREDKELQLCTFKPTIQGLPNYLRQTQPNDQYKQNIGQTTQPLATQTNWLDRSQSSIQHSIYLFSQAKDKEVKLNEQRKQQLEERLKQECTFKPNITPLNISHSKPKITQLNQDNQCYINTDEELVNSIVKRSKSQTAHNTSMEIWQRLSKKPKASFQDTKFQNICEMQADRDSLVGNVNDEYYLQKIQKECKVVISSIRDSMNRVGLIFDEFVNLMIKFGYGKIEHIDLMSTVFHAMTGFAKDIHSGYQTQNFQKQVLIMNVDQLKALFYCIRNCFDADVLHNIKAYPEALNLQVTLAKTKYTYFWKLDSKKDFLKFHKILVPFNASKTQYEHDLKKNRRIQEILKNQEIPQRTKSRSPSKNRGQASSDLNSDLLPTASSLSYQKKKSQSILEKPQVKQVLHKMWPQVSMSNQILYKLEQAQKKQNEELRYQTQVLNALIQQQEPPNFTSGSMNAFESKLTKIFKGPGRQFDQGSVFSKSTLSIMQAAEQLQQFNLNTSTQKSEYPFAPLQRIKQEVSSSSENHFSEYEDNDPDDLEDDIIFRNQLIQSSRKRQTSFPSLNDDLVRQNSDFKQDAQDFVKEQQPLIHLDVTIGTGQQAPLIIYACENAIEIAETFCNFNDVTGIKKDRLFKAVSDAISCIEEERKILQANLKTE